MKSGPTTWCCRKIVVLSLLFISDIAFWQYIERNNKVKGILRKNFTGVGGDEICKKMYLDWLRYNGHDAKARNNRKKEKEGGNDRTHKKFFKISLSKKYHEAKIKGEWQTGKNFAVYVQN